MATKENYLRAFNEAYGTKYATDKSGAVVDENGTIVNDIDYTKHEGYGALKESQKNKLQNWYDAYLNDEATLKAATEEKLQAAKTNDLYLKYLNANNKMSGLAGQGVADSSLLRLQNNYMSALGKINSDKASEMSRNYQAAMNAQRVNEEGALVKTENEIARAVESAYSSGMTFQEAKDKLSKAYEENSSLVDKYMAHYGNWADQSAEYDGDTPVTSVGWTAELDEFPESDVVARATENIKGANGYIKNVDIITDEQGHQWKVVGTSNDKGFKIANYIVEGGQNTEDGNITKGKNGTYVMAIAGYDWLILKPID